MKLSNIDSNINDQFRLIQLSRKGIPFPVFQSIATRSSFSMNDWSQFMHLTERTLQRYKKEQRDFEPIHSEKILEIAKLQHRGKDVFGSAELFDEWMNTEILALGGERPKAFLDSSFGIAMIHEELTRIEHGVLA